MENLQQTYSRRWLATRVGESGFTCSGCWGEDIGGEDPGGEVCCYNCESLVCHASFPFQAAN